MQIEQILDVIDRRSAWSWIRRAYLPDGVKCPVCGAGITGDRALASFEAMERTYCKSHRSCFRPGSAIVPLRGTEWAPEEFVKLLLLQACGKDAAGVARILGKSTACVRDMFDRLEVSERLAVQVGLSALVAGDKG